MAETIRKIRKWRNEPTPTKRKWIVDVSVALAVLYAGAAIGLYRYQESQDDAAARVAFEACLRRVDSRTEIRGMFLTTFEVIEESVGDPHAFDSVRLRLDVRYPPLDAAEC